MTVLRIKSGAGGTWEEVGGVGIGIPTGGSAGQILTKSSAADYATAWTSTPPILVNNTFLQGYNADGTTVQSLIGVATTDDITLGAGLASGKRINAGRSLVIPNGEFVRGTTVAGTTHELCGTHNDDVTYIALGCPGAINIAANAVDTINIGLNLAAGKNIYVPRLTVQGVLTLAEDQWHLSSAGAQIVYAATGSGNCHFSGNRNAYFNGSSGFTTFARDVNVVGVLYKGAVPYTHPDFVFEHHFTGGIERFRDAPGADTYEGLWPLARVEEFAQEHWRLPGHAARENDRVDIFRRTHDLLAELERVYLHMFDHEKRLAALEGR